VKTLILILILSLAIPSSAFAVRRVEKKPKQQSGSNVTAGQDQNKDSGEKKAGEGHNSAPDQGRTIVPEKQKDTKVDKFIDKNNDGINDRIEVRSPVKVRKRDDAPKRDEKPREKPDRKSDDDGKKKDRRG